MRIFSIPFNKVSYKEYETLLKRYEKEQIHSIYFSLPEIDNHLYEEQEEDVSKDFLRNTMDYKRLVVYNDGCYPYEDKELFRHMDKCIFPLIEKYRIDGFIVTNVNLSRYIKQNFPNMEMHLSCKNPSYHVKQTKNWINYGKIDVVNSPREFGRMPSLLKEFHNLIIIRTFSKSYCFAGARLGFVIAAPDVINTFITVKNSFNHFPIDSIIQKLGIATCNDYTYYQEINAKIAKTRDWFSCELKKLGYDVIPSKTNFVFVKKDGLSGEEIYKEVKKAGILIRHFNHNGIENYVRITIGTQDEMDLLLNAMKNISSN